MMTDDITRSASFVRSLLGWYHKGYPGLTRPTSSCHQLLAGGPSTAQRRRLASAKVNPHLTGKSLLAYYRMRE